MRIETNTAKVFTIFDAPKLDPIQVVMMDYGGGAGRLIVACYGDSWTGYWGAMGTTLEDFVCSGEADYIAGKMEPQLGKRTKSNATYLLRIVEAVREALRFNAEMTSLSLVDCPVIRPKGEK